ncbi:MAG: hypothetical protein IKW54_04410 [Bacteroidales bacterium]|nr:hypothetical protein [Bacteroidales bacterium]
MKVKITTLALFMFCIVIHGNAQQTDGFFSYRYYSEERASYLAPNVGLYQFYGVGIDNMEMNTETVSVGGGLFALMVMSASYLALRRKEEER